MTDKSPDQNTPANGQPDNAGGENDDAMAIEFRGQSDESKPVPPSKKKTSKQSRTPAVGGDVISESPGPITQFEIEGFEEERPPAKGHLFAEVPPEPPRQPYEMVPEPRLTWPHRAPRQESLPAFVLHSDRPPVWIRFFWGFLPLIIFITGFASVLFSQDSVGYAWDEAYYYEPSLKAADWLTEVLRGNQPFDAKTIDEYWANGKTGPDAMGFGYTEHPSFQKLLCGISLRIFKDPLNHIFAMRLPIAIMFGMTLSLLYLLGRRAWGPVPGLVGVVLYATMPRIFGHAHFTSMETPLVFMTIMVVFCYLRGLDSAAWAVLTGVVFGLLLDTKINGFFLPIPLVIWSHLYARNRYVNNLFSMLVLGPLVMVLAWPWLWHDTVVRLMQYLAFHAVHQKTALYFMGVKWGYGGPDVPWFYPLVMIAVTVPLSGLFLITWGILRVLHRPHRRPMGALFLFCALVNLAVACAPSTPRYDGVRLFLPVFPFLALLGGDGTVALIRIMERMMHRLSYAEHRARRILRTLATAIFIIVLLEGGSALWRYHPYELSYFNPVVGGLKGAQARGFETTYWGEAVNRDVVTALNNLPNGSRVKPLALHELCLMQQQEWGLIKTDLIFNGPPPYDYHLLQFRRGFFANIETLLADSGRYKPLKIWGRWGVPLVALYPRL